MKEKNNTLVEIYADATMLSREQKQTIGKKNDFYITLKQLEILLKKHY